MKYVYGILPVIIKYTNKDIPAIYGGISRGIVIKIKPKYLNDKGLLEHELTHIKQFYKAFPFHGLFYKFIRAYRLKSELEAYKKQIEYLTKKEDIDIFANRLSLLYDLNITKEEALKLLKED